MSNMLTPCWRLQLRMWWLCACVRCSKWGEWGNQLGKPNLFPSNDSVFALRFLIMVVVRQITRSKGCTVHNSYCADIKCRTWAGSRRSSSAELWPLCRCLSRTHVQGDDFLRGVAHRWMTWEGCLAVVPFLQFSEIAVAVSTSAPRRPVWLRTPKTVRSC